jgi:hypothetical protein
MKEVARLHDQPDGPRPLDLTINELYKVLLKSQKFIKWRPKLRPQDIQPALSGKDRVLERHYSVAEVATLWGISVDFVRDIFKHEPDVLALERTGSKKYVTLRIPETVLVRVHQRLSRS